MVRVALAAVLVALWPGCSFDTSGVGAADRGAVHEARAAGPRDGSVLPGDGGADRPGDRAGDRTFADTARDGLSDNPAPTDRAQDQLSPDVALPDVALPDVAPPDVALPDVAPPVPVGISAAALGSALWATWVDCVKSDGNPGTPSPLRIVDTDTVAFVDGAVTLAGAPTETTTWAQGKPTVTVVFDPNACDNEGPAPETDSWSSAGLLVRGAELKQGELWLAPGSTMADFDLLNVNTDGTYQEESFGADDAQLATLPQLVAPITAAKAKLLELGLP